MILQASLLEYAKGLTQVAAEGAAVTDCVLVVPAFFGPAQRQAMLDAARLAGLNPMGLINTHAAAALQYGIERDFTNRTEDVIFYDLGSSSVQVALVTFSAYDTPTGSVSQFEVKDVAWAERTGGADLEAALVTHFAGEYASKNSEAGDPLGSPRAVAKLRRQCKRTKEVLSANSEAQISVEDLMPGSDFRSSISRDTFEGLVDDVWARALAPVEELLKRNNLTVNDVAAFELLGGSSRVPKVKTALSEALGGRTLDMHLDADEAVVLGAGLFAANLSTTFRLRKFGMTDRVPYSVTFKLEGEGVDAETSADGGAPTERVLVPAMRKMPTRRAISLTTLTGDSFKASLEWDNAPGAVLPCCHRKEPLGEFEVSGVADVVSKYNGTDKVTLHTRVDGSGVFVVEKADAAVEIEEEVPVKPAPSANATEAAAADTAGSNNATETNSTEAAAGGDAAPAPEAAPEVVYEKVKRNIKVPLTMTGSLTIPGLTSAQFGESRDKLRALKRRDDAKKDTAKARNDLEAYIINMRGKLDGSNALIQQVTIPQQREELSSKLTQAEDWLYGEEGEAAPGATLKEKLASLKKLGDAIERRASEKFKRPTAVSNAMDFAAGSKDAVKKWETTKPWIEAADKEALIAKLDAFDNWLLHKVGAQEALDDHEDPAFTIEDLRKEMEDSKKAFNKLNSKRAPPPPPPPSPPPKAETAANETESAPAAGGSDVDGAAASEEKTAGQGQEGTAEDVHEELKK